MSLPNLPPFYKMPWTDGDGNMTPESLMYSDETFQTLNFLVYLANQILNSTYSSNNTITLDSLNAPQKTTAQITAYGSDSSIPNGAIWFDTDVSKLKVKTASATIETITSS